MSAAIPQLPDDVLRQIMIIKHQNFVRDLPAIAMRRTIRVAARLESERQQAKKRLAICQLRCALFLGCISITLLVYFYLFYE